MVAGSQSTHEGSTVRRAVLWRVLLDGVTACRSARVRTDLEWLESGMEVGER